MTPAVSPADGWRVGSDLVCAEGNRLLIHASQPMDWPIREFFRVPIFVQERKYYLRSTTPASPPHVGCYELWPWPADLHEESPDAIRYDEAYVARRDGEMKQFRRANGWHLFLLPAYPFLGLLWSGCKGRWLARVGFEPSSITKASVVLAFNVWVLEGIFVGWLNGGLLMLIFSSASGRWTDWVFLIVLTADTVVRFSGIIRDGTAYQLGFCEWLWPGNKDRH